MTGSMRTMALRTRALPALLALLILATLPATAVRAAAPVDPRETTATTIVGTGLGATRSRPAASTARACTCRATYSVVLSLKYGTRAFSVNSAATITNTSGGPIDRVEFNTVAARLGGGLDLRLGRSRWPAGQRPGPRPDDRRAARRRPGRAARPRPSAIKYGATLRTSLSGSNWLFTKVNGIVRRLPLDAVGQPPDAVRPAEPRRPVRDADQPVVQDHGSRRTAGSSSRRPAIACPPRRTA